ncbi:RAD55 family ATPase [Halopiger goleimassiliensis]|uniref:RAD55 family ATPase n=1 Tax=Halopiger goleimassiliensis TaxID=1293048 RepID=UPI000677EF26|nr:transcriptional regulator [Halopiger goleimassiliensis]
MDGRLETGIEVLDRKLDGGVPPGYVIAFTADPASQSELLLYELTAIRGTLYLSTERTDDVIREAIDRSPSDVGNPTVRHVADENPLEEATRLIEALPDGANLIIDTMDVLERTDTEAYVSFLNDLKARMLETGSIAVLHCLKGSDEPPNRTRTHHAADAVFDLETAVTGTDLQNMLAIPKFRDGGQPTETIKLELTEEVAIDTSRDIA